MLWATLKHEGMVAVNCRQEAQIYRQPQPRMNGLVVPCVSLDNRWTQPLQEFMEHGCLHKHKILEKCWVFSFQLHHQMLVPTEQLSPLQPWATSSSFSAGPRPQQHHHWYHYQSAEGCWLVAIEWEGPYWWRAGSRLTQTHRKKYIKFLYYISYGCTVVIIQT